MHRMHPRSGARRAPAFRTASLALALLLPGVLLGAAPHTAEQNFVGPSAALAGAPAGQAAAGSAAAAAAQAAAIAQAAETSEGAEAQAAKKPAAEKPAAKVRAPADAKEAEEISRARLLLAQWLNAAPQNIGQQLAQRIEQGLRQGLSAEAAKRIAMGRAAFADCLPLAPLRRLAQSGLGEGLPGLPQPGAAPPPEAAQPLLWDIGARLGRGSSTAGAAGAEALAGSVTGTVAQAADIDATTRCFRNAGARLFETRTLRGVLRDAAAGGAVEGARNFGRLLFGENFRLQSDLTWSGRGIHGEIDAVFPLVYKERARGGAIAVFLQPGAVMWEPDAGSLRRDVNIGLVARRRLVNGWQFGGSVFYDHNLQDDLQRLSAGLELAHKGITAGLHGYWPLNSDWRNPGDWVEGRHENGIRYEHIALRGVDFRGSWNGGGRLKLDGAVGRWQTWDEKYLVMHSTLTARAGASLWVAPGMQLRAAYEYFDNRLLSSRWNVGVRYQWPRNNRYATAYAAHPGEAPLPDIWAPVQREKRILYASRANTTPSAVEASAFPLAVDSGDVVTLNARFTDPDPYEKFVYSWTQVTPAAPAVVNFANATGVCSAGGAECGGGPSYIPTAATFTAPEVTEEATPFVFRFMVTDRHGNPNSATAMVAISPGESPLNVVISAAPNPAQEGNTISINAALTPENPRALDGDTTYVWELLPQGAEWGGIGGGPIVLTQALRGNVQLAELSGGAAAMLPQSVQVPTDLSAPQSFRVRLSVTHEKLVPGGAGTTCTVDEAAQLTTCTATSPVINVDGMDESPTDVPGPPVPDPAPEDEFTPRQDIDLGLGSSAGIDGFCMQPRPGNLPPELSPGQMRVPLGNANVAPPSIVAGYERRTRTVNTTVRIISETDTALSVADPVTTVSRTPLSGRRAGVTVVTTVVTETPVPANASPVLRKERRTVVTTEVTERFTVNHSLTYAWAQDPATIPPTITITHPDTSSVQAFFDAPTGITEETRLGFHLTVTASATFPAPIGTITEEVQCWRRTGVDPWEFNVVPPAPEITAAAITRATTPERDNTTLRTNATRTGNIPVPEAERKFALRWDATRGHAIVPLVEGDLVPAEIVGQGHTVTLTGTAIPNPDGGALIAGQSWAQTGGADVLSVQIQNANSLVATFQAGEETNPIPTDTLLTFTLSVTDVIGNVAQLNVPLTVRPQVRFIRNNDEAGMPITSGPAQFFNYLGIYDGSPGIRVEGIGNFNYEYMSALFEGGVSLRGRGGSTILNSAGRPAFFRGFPAQFFGLNFFTINSEGNLAAALRGFAMPDLIPGTTDVTQSGFVTRGNIGDIYEVRTTKAIGGAGTCGNTGRDQFGLEGCYEYEWRLNIITSRVGFVEAWDVRWVEEDGVTPRPINPRIGLNYPPENWDEGIFQYAFSDNPDIDTAFPRARFQYIPNTRGGGHCLALTVWDNDSTFNNVPGMRPVGLAQPNLLELSASGDGVVNFLCPGQRPPGAGPR